MRANLRCLAPAQDDRLGSLDLVGIVMISHGMSLADLQARGMSDARDAWTLVERRGDARQRLIGLPSREPSRPWVWSTSERLGREAVRRDCEASRCFGCRDGQCASQLQVMSTRSKSVITSPVVRGGGRAFHAVRNISPLIASHCLSYAKPLCRRPTVLVVNTNRTRIEKANTGKPTGSNPEFSVSGRLVRIRGGWRWQTPVVRGRRPIRRSRSWFLHLFPDGQRGRRRVWRRTGEGWKNGGSNDGSFWLCKW